MYRRAKRDSLRPLTSEVLPYEVPVPFSTARFYTFLRRLRFEWVKKNEFRVRRSRLGPGEKRWLDLIFDPIQISKGVTDGDYQVFNLASGGGSNCDLRHPYKFRTRRNNGKSRELSVPHPHSMLLIAEFIHQHRDSILYYTSRSNFSIRHPHRVARLQKRRRSIFDGVYDRESYGSEQSDLEYAYVSSYFSYHRYNNINRFFASNDFHACERKFTHLMKVDVSKCFDSIYTHTISWVCNGEKSSKAFRNKTISTFGGKFDRLMQYLNYAETSGVIIGPEVSRIFAEIILQEVDIRVEQKLSKHNLILGKDYVVMRYVDDYFVFLADARHSTLVEEVLSECLAAFKLHLNELKQRHFDTPLDSIMSIAKVRIRESLKLRTRIDFASEESASNSLYFYAQRAILDYKSIILDTGLDHSDLANSFLYELQQRRDRTVRRFREYLKDVSQVAHRQYSKAQLDLVRYLTESVRVGFFIYSSAPSVSHSIKLARLIAASLRELAINNISAVAKIRFRDEIRKELISQLSAVRDEPALGTHNLTLLDCLFLVDPSISEDSLRDILRQRKMSVDDLDAFAVLTLLRRFRTPNTPSQLREELLDQARKLIDRGRGSKREEGSRAVLLLSLPTYPGAPAKRIADAMGCGFSGRDVLKLRSSSRTPSLFAWDVDKDYFDRLLLKASQAVY